MLLFVDESGHDHREMPCEVLAGVAVAEDSLWNLVRAIRAAEKERFGGYLRDLLSEERKGRNLLKKKRFKIAGKPLQLSAAEQTALANSLLRKGKEAKAKKLSSSGETYPKWSPTAEPFSTSYTMSLTWQPALVSKSSHLL